ncbi:MAG: C1 family peptidase [Candidatus Eisenbacteria bacterium]
MKPYIQPIVALTSILILIGLATGTAYGLPPTLDDIQDAIQDQGLDWTAASQSVWQKTWAEKDSILGCIIPALRDPGDDLLLRLPRVLLRELPDSIDWRDHGDTNYVSSVKDQGHCGSCWAFAACGVVESLRKIKGYSPCGCENLSEQFLVSCDIGVGGNLGCNGGYPDRTANYLQNTGTPDEACFPYKAKQLLCAQRCDDWASRVRKISGWSYVRNGGSTSGQTIDSMKTALTVAPQWTTMYVYEDFYAYDGGVYEYATGEKQGGHAIMLVGYNDADNCFICKNSWGTAWGENGYFRIDYNQIDSGVEFGKYTITYDMDPEDDESVDDCHRYALDLTGPFEWLPGTQGMAVHSDDEVVLAQPPFAVKYCCLVNPGPIGLSTNGWLGMGGSYTRDAWPEHSCIPSSHGPGSMVAPLWTDLDPSMGGDIYTGNPGDGRWVVEYRNIPRKDIGTPETFEVIFYDPQVHPTPTGDSIIRFQYLTHHPLGEYQAVGIENHEQTCGVQMYCNGEGTPIGSGLSITFTPVPYGDEHPAEAPTGLWTQYSEPYAELVWNNPVYNTEGFELPFLDRVVVERDGVVRAELHGEPGEEMSWLDRDPGAGGHIYTVYAVAGNATGLSAEAGLSVPPRIDHLDHDAGNVVFTVTDQGICGFMDATQGVGSGFVFGEDGINRLFLGSLWAGTDAEYALNRDYDEDPYPDWQFRASFAAPPLRADQEFAAACDDQGHPYARGLCVEQYSRAWTGAPDDDFVILTYRLRNEGAAEITGLYVGQFMDWDVSPASPWSEQGAADPDERLVYMWHDLTHPYVGVALLDTVPPAAAPAANLTLIHNPTFVYPLGYIGDTDRALFLSGGDPAHSVAASWEANDWSVMASAGPFALDPGNSLTVAFAVLGGEDEADLRANAAAAYLAYNRDPAGLVGEEGAPRALRLHANRPNPFGRATTIRLELPRATEVEVAVFDAAGRLVRVLLEGRMEAGLREISWDGRDAALQPVASGIYFTCVKAQGELIRRQIVVVH